MRDEVLEFLRQNQGSFVSGQDMSEACHVSRTAIWKHIKALRQKGYKIESYTKRGYRLLEEPDLLSPLAMKQILKTDVFGKRYVYMDVTESTNLEARRLAQQGAEEGTVVGLDNQKFNEKEENCYLDPRCEVLWFRPTSLDDLNAKDGIHESDKEFGGYRNGVTEVGSKYTTVYSPMRVDQRTDVMNRKVWWNLAREIVWMGYSESLFLKAEAALRGWAGLPKTDAKKYYEEGIRASMNYYEIDADAEGQQKIDNYINHLAGMKAFTSGSDEEQLEQIITQKWLAVYPNGNEGWAEVRRTDYPRYLLLPRYGNNSNGEVENTKLIKRISYPNSESRNPLKPNYTQGTRVWWDVDDTMDDSGKWHTPNNFR